MGHARMWCVTVYLFEAALSLLIESLRRNHEFIQGTGSLRFRHQSMSERSSLKNEGPAQFTNIELQQVTQFLNRLKHANQNGFCDKPRRELQNAREQNGFLSRGTAPWQEESLSQVLERPPAISRTPLRNKAKSSLRPVDGPPPRKEPLPLSEVLRSTPIRPPRPAWRPRSASQTRPNPKRDYERQCHLTNGHLNDKQRRILPRDVSKNEEVGFREHRFSYRTVLIDRIERLVKVGVPAVQGIVNDGVYCYAIVLIQSLLGTNAFARLAIASQVDWKNNAPIVARFIQALHLLWINDPSSSIAVKNLLFKQIEINTLLDVTRQQDVLEFMTILINAIYAVRSTEKFPDLTGAKKIKELCTGSLVYTSRCTSCRYERTKKEVFTSLSLPLSQETYNEVNIYAVVKNEIYAYGLRSKETPVMKDLINCLVQDAHVSKQNSAVMCISNEEIVVFHPDQALSPATSFNLHTVVQLCNIHFNYSYLNTVVFVRGSSFSPPFICNLDLTSSSPVRWNSIVRTVFSEERPLPKPGELLIKIANVYRTFDNFAVLGSTDLAPIVKTNSFWPAHCDVPFIILKIDLQFSRKRFVVKSRPEHRHDSFVANMGPLVDRLLTNYFKEEYVMFTCRQCAGDKLKRSVHLETCPPVLFLHMNRFAQNLYSTVKLKNKIRIPRDLLDLTPYFKVPQNNSNSKYLLSAVICHLGDTVSSGHYQCFRRNPVTGSWSLFSDSQVFQDLFPDYLTSATAYLLIYENISADSVPGSNHWFRKLDAGKLADSISELQLCGPQ
ncbi:hypothetical protein L596_004017 [Steinernema carpocapsae]|uniref:USP domain-containing protein n=1 Tax=Steinernema carpocapsae TaxID=34508 RepID=A0A4U8UYI7_STECR|nr:hypothetical protein L596_004017 [Steinernema carpocapsae]